MGSLETRIWVTWESAAANLFNSVSCSCLSRKCHTRHLGVQVAFDQTESAKGFLPTVAAPESVFCRRSHDWEYLMALRAAASSTASEAQCQKQTGLQAVGWGKQETRQKGFWEGAKNLYPFLHSNDFPWCCRTNQEKQDAWSKVGYIHSAERQACPRSGQKALKDGGSTERSVHEDLWSSEVLQLLVFLHFYFERLQTHKEVARLIQRTSIFPSPGFTILNILHICLILLSSYTYYLPDPLEN